MPPIIRRYVTRQVLFAVLILSITGTGPAVFISLFTTLRGNALFTRLAWPVLASVTPILLYHILPVVVAASAVWCVSKFSAEGTLTIMQSAGISPRSLRARMMTLALWMTGVGYLLAWVVAPSSAGCLHDLLFSLRYDVNPALLQPGKFNQMDHGRKVIFFENSSDGQYLTDVFLVEKDWDGSERSYSAPIAMITNDDGKSSFVMLHGTTQYLDRSKGERKVVGFNAVGIPLSTFGSGATRTETFVDELGPVRFFQARPDAASDPETAGWWWRDAAKRVGIPPITLIHTLLGLSILAALGNRSRHHRNWTMLVWGILTVLHVALVILVEMVFYSNQAAFLAVVLAGGELGAAFVLLAVSDSAAVWRRRWRSLARLLVGVSRTTAPVNYSRIVVFVRRVFPRQLHSNHRGSPALPTPRARP